MIGAVLKTVVRASVPWVRIPPPPPFKKSLKRLFFSAFPPCPQTAKMSQNSCIEVSVLRRADGAIILGNRLVLRFLGVGNNQTM